MGAQTRRACRAARAGAKRRTAVSSPARDSWSIRCRSSTSLRRGRTRALSTHRRATPGAWRVGASLLRLGGPAFVGRNATCVGVTLSTPMDAHSSSAAGDGASVASRSHRSILVGATDATSRTSRASRDSLLARATHRIRRIVDGRNAPQDRCFREHFCSRRTDCRPLPCRRLRRCGARCARGSARRLRTTAAGMSRLTVPLGRSPITARSGCEAPTSSSR